ncbi:hypothetical protein ACFY1A_17215 [Streptomyces sp. NPDC001520]|uniref:hypothetical protein n=1 Tax=Streptomyces sp. NPDC001520 TaxID=3364581 RepID=UPI00367B6579
MNGVELRYHIYKSLIGEVYGTQMVSPVPGEPLRIGVMVKDPNGKFRKFTVSIEED